MIHLFTFYIQIGMVESLYASGSIHKTIVFTIIITV